MILVVGVGALVARTATLAVSGALRLAWGEAAIAKVAVGKPVGLFSKIDTGVTVSEAVQEPRTNEQRIRVARAERFDFMDADCTFSSVDRLNSKQSQLGIMSPSSPHVPEPRQLQESFARESRHRQESGGA